ncbi:MAG: hypothetical protein WC726_00560 [Parcubacteria group bacterium]|jgi:hypothetical protein
MNTKYRKKISIGYNGKKDFFDQIILPYKYYISSVYTAPPTSMNIASSRAVPHVTKEEMLDLRKRLKKEKIEFNLVFNFDGIDDPKIIKTLLLSADYFKPDLITLNGTYVLDSFLKITKYKLNISIINDINSLNQLDQLLERDLKGNYIVSYNIGRRKTFDPKYIKSVRSRYPKLRLKLMVNEGCIFECPDQNFHSCSNTMRKKDHPSDRIFYCQKFESPEHWRFLTGQYIPPKFLSNYCDLVDEFKIASRGSYYAGMDTTTVVELLKEYIEERDISIKRAMLSSYGGTYFAQSYFKNNPESEKGNYSKTYPDDFFKVRSKCKHNCYDCGYCRDILDS